MYPNLSLCVGFIVLRRSASVSRMSFPTLSQSVGCLPSFPSLHLLSPPGSYGVRRDLACLVILVACLLKQEVDSSAGPGGGLSAAGPVDHLVEHLATLLLSAASVVSRKDVAYQK